MSFKNICLCRDFVDDSDSSSYSESISSSESSESSSSSRERVKKRPPNSRPGPQNVKKSATSIQNPIRNSFTITRVPTKKEIEQKGRFYDKSRNIPNDVYFGDVKGTNLLLS